MIDEKHVYELNHLIPNIFETKRADHVIDKIVEHIEILESHIERISESHQKLYSGKHIAERYLSSDIKMAKDFLLERNAKRLN